MHKHSRANMDIIYRACRSCDLKELEWFGMFYNHRSIIQDSFKRHKLGTNYMIVAEANSFPIAQVWIDLEKKKHENTGVIWALRVLQPFQRLGIGTDLIRISEDYLRRKKYSFSEINVEKDNLQARRLYERLGYIPVGQETEEYSFVTPDRIVINGKSVNWILQKPLELRLKKEVNNSAVQV
ncbi:MAG: GNAT family N-acetyltransferase [Bacillota bacterium]